MANTEPPANPVPKAQKAAGREEASEIVKSNGAADTGTTSKRQPPGVRLAELPGRLVAEQAAVLAVC